jgi:hypothetical protein
MEGTALVAVIGAILGFLAKMGSDWLGLTRDRWARGETRIIDIEKAQRDQLQSSLQNATASVNLYISRWLTHQRQLERAQNDAEMVRLNSEVMKWIVSVFIFYPKTNVNGYEELLRFTYQGNHQAIMKEEQAWAVRQLLVSLAAIYQKSNNEAVKVLADVGSIRRFLGA